MYLPSRIPRIEHVWIVEVLVPTAKNGAPDDPSENNVEMASRQDVYTRDDMVPVRLDNKNESIACRKRP